MIQHYNEYRSYLRFCLTEKIKRNPQYSLRAFAKDLQLAPGFVSDILKGRKNLSTQSVHKVADALKLNSKESAYFNVLVQLETATTQAARLKLTQDLEALYPKRQSSDLSLDYFRIIAEWYHTAIMEMATSSDIKVDAASVAKALGITKLEAQTAIDRLLRLELLEVGADERLVKTRPSLLVQSATPHEGIQRFHKQMLEKAILSLETQTNKQKFVGSETFAFDPESLSLVSEAIEECFGKVVSIAKKSKKKKQVYHLGIQFFKLTQGDMK